MLFQLLGISLFAVSAIGVKQHFFCKPGKEIHIPGADENTVYLRGPRGFPGAKGIAGLPGFTGETGEADYEYIFRKIDVKLNSAMNALKASFNERMSNLERLVASTATAAEQASTTAEQATTGAALSNRDIEVDRLRAKGLCPVQHENICFWAEVRHHQDIYESTAISICQKEGGEVGNIYSRQHYDNVMTLIRSLSPVGLGSEPARTWTAMKVKPNGDVTLSDGSPAPYLKWLASWYPVEGQTGIMLSVPRDPRAYYQGMTDIVSTKNAYGVLCQS